MVIIKQRKNPALQIVPIATALLVGISMGHYFATKGDHAACLSTTSLSTTANAKRSTNSGTDTNSDNQQEQKQEPKQQHNQQPQQRRQEQNHDSLTPSNGWNPIHIYYGKMDHLHDPIPDRWYVKHSEKNANMSQSKEWFGQHGQDVAVAKLFNFERGFFVDLASNDAVWASNTFALEQNLDWQGICIEGNPIYWYRLAFRKCQVVGTIVGHEDGQEIAVHLPTDAKISGPLGGIVGNDFDNKKSREPQKRYTASLVSILQKFNAPTMIDYLSLDVEGAEEFIMKDFPFHQPYTFRAISIERPKELLRQKLNEAGYQHVLDFRRGDTLWAHSSIYQEGKQRLETNRHEIDRHQLDEWPHAMLQN